MTDPQRRTREDYEQGLPGYHDPTARFAGSTTGRSALTSVGALPQVAWGAELMT